MQVGSIVADRFELRAVVGGGMGQVFRAEDHGTGRSVALKLLLAAEPRDLVRFRREARTLAMLRHDAIVGHVAHGETEGQPYLVMDWLEGEDLARALRRGPLRVTEVVALLRRVASALAAAHAQGFVHRDLKPANIMLVGGECSRATLVDFGIARPALERGLTRTGAVIGTVGYMAPEQIQGVSDLDGRADLFALGCVAYECLTGRAAFGGDALVAVLSRILLDDAPRVRESLPSVPESLDAMIAGLLARDRMARTPSAQALLDALAGLELGVEASREPAGISPATRPSLQGEREPIAVVLAWPGVRESFGDTLAATDTLERPSALAAHSLAGMFGSIASRWGGRTMPLIGDMVIASFERGSAVQERVRRAARAALELHAARPECRVSIGLALTQAGPAGRPSVTATPEPDFDQPSHVLHVDAGAAAFLADEFVLERHADGWSLTAERERDETRPVLGRSVPCLGRDRELQLLDATLDVCIDEQIVRALVLVGAPGLGKSRIRREFVARVRARVEPGHAEIWLARSDLGTQSVALGLVRAWLAAAFGLRATTAHDRWTELCTAALPLLARDVGPERAAELVEFLGELGDRPPPEPGAALIEARSNPRYMRGRLEAALVAWLRGAALVRPIVLLLEDLHWADTSSTSLLASAWSRLDEVPILLVTTSWPEAEHTHPHVFELRGAQVVKLEPLGKRAAERLVEQLLGERSDAAQNRRIVELASGNVFLLEEIVRHVGEGRSLDELPTTAIAVVQSRLAALPEEARRVLRLAAALGERFDPAALALLGPSPTDSRDLDVELVLERLRRDELVSSPLDKRETGTSWSLRHSLVRQAAYEMLTPDDRTSAHRAAAAWYMARSGADPVVIADHLEQADCHREAGPWLLRAITEREELGDIESMIELARRADHPDVDPDVRAEAVYLGFNAKLWGERFHELGAIIERIDGNEFPPGSRGWAALQVASVVVKVHAGIPVDARAQVHALVEHGARFPPTIASVMNLSLLVVTCTHLGLFDEGFQVARMLDEMTTGEVPILWVMLRDAYVPWLLAAADDASALARHREALMLARRCSPMHQAEIIPPYILFALEFGCEAEARRIVDELEAREDLPLTDFQLIGLAWLACRSEPPRDCRDLLARQRSPELKYTDLWLRVICAVSPAFARPDAPEVVHKAIAELEQVLAECQDLRVHRCGTLMLLAECALLIDDAERAWAWSEASREAGDVLMPVSRSCMHLARVRALRGLGRSDDAERELAAARARLHRFAEGLSADDRASFLATPSARALLE